MGGTRHPPLEINFGKFQIIRALNSLFSLLSNWTQIDHMMLSSVTRGAATPPLAQEKKKKEGKNALSAHLHGLIAVAQLSNGF